MNIYKYNIKSFFITLFFLIGLLFSLWNTIYTSSLFVLANITIRESFFEKNDINFKGTHIPGERYFNILKQNYYDLKNINITNIKQTIDKINKIDINQSNYSIEFDLINKLLELSKLPHSEKKISALYISKNIKSYWNMSCDSHMPPFIAPSITNMVLLDGLPSEGKDTCYTHLIEYGYSRYKLFQKKPSDVPLNSNQLCIKAKKDNLMKVIHIMQNNQNKFITKIYNCK